MLKLTGAQKGWFAIVIALWIMALAAMIFVLRRVYGEEITAFAPVCSDEPQELIDAKLEAAGEHADKVTFENGENYMMVTKDPQAGVSFVDAIPSDVLDLCNGNYFDQFFSTDQGYPVHWDNENNIWRFGFRAG